MFSGLTEKLGLATAQRLSSVPDGIRVYAIGDIHGRLDLLTRMMRLIADNLATSPDCVAQCVLLGDYIDRGPQSAAVLELLSGGHFPMPLTALRGNHEQMLLNFLDDATSMEFWRSYGGIETVHSFGIDPKKARDPQYFEEVRQQLKGALPATSVRFLEQTTFRCTIGDYFFCHAGVRPGVPLAAQRDEDLISMRQTFTGSRVEHGKIVVHGHTPVEQPEVHVNRINIDTGAYITGTLTCLVLEATTRRFLST